MIAKQANDISKNALDSSRADDRRNFELGQQSYNSQSKAYQESAKQYITERTPYLQASDFEVHQGAIGQNPNGTYVLSNISSTPVKIIETSTVLYLFQKEPTIDSFAFKKLLMNRYVIKETPADIKWSLDTPLSETNHKLIFENGWYLYAARSIRYRNLITGKIRVYKFVFKFKPIVDNPVYDLIYSENFDE